MTFCTVRYECMSNVLQRRHGAALILAIAAFAPACMRGIPDAVPVKGNVVNQHGQALANAKACVGSTSECATTDAAGNFTLNYSGKSGDVIALNFAATGFARQAQPVTAKVGAWVPVILRNVGSVTDVTLPAAGEAPVTASVTSNGNTMTLTIPGGAMVDPNGNVVSGAATVTLTYWHPLQQLTSTPAPLLAENPNNPNNAVPLATWGMGDIEVQQNGTLLNVTPGQHLTWQLDIPPSLGAMINANTVAMPNLYSVNPNTGLWHYEGNMGSGSLALNGNTWVAKLPHLSAWNIDDDSPPSAGGCVQGTVNYSSGGGAANLAIIVWFLGDEELKDWHTTTDGSGNYCINTPITLMGDAAQYTHYFVSGADSYTDTNMCNPAPADCFNCTYENVTVDYGWCSLCRYTDPADPGNTAPDGYGSISLYPDTCGAAQVTINGGTFCNSGCSQLNTAVAPKAVPPCPKVLPQGQSCDPTSTTACCVDGYVCSDYLCVPH